MTGRLQLSVLWIGLQLGVVLFSISSSHATPQAILISGAARSARNYCRYYRNIAHVHSALQGWEMTNLVADGPLGTGDNSIACNPNVAADGSDSDSLFDPEGHPVLTRQEPVGGSQGAATLPDIRRAFQESIKKLKPGEPFLVYTTDHGNPTGSPILWGSGALSADELHGLLLQVPSNSLVILIGEQCFGEGMTRALQGSEGRPLPNMCGFSRARSDELGFGEGSLGRAILDTSQSNPGLTGMAGSFSDAVQVSQQRSDLSSSTMATSDIFLENYANANQMRLQNATAQAQVLSDCLWSESGLHDLLNRNHLAVNPLIQVELMSLRTSLRSAYALAGVSESISKAELDSHLRDAHEGLAAQEHHLQSLRQIVNEATVEWLRSTNSPIYERWKKANDALAAAVQETPQNIEKMNRASEAMKQPDLEISREQAAVARGTNNAFNEWAKGKSLTHTQKLPNSTRSGPVEIPISNGVSSVAQDYAALESSEPQAGNRLRNINNLTRLLNNFNALKSMLSHGDTDAFGQYMRLLQCEHTAIHQGAPAGGAR